MVAGKKWSFLVAGLLAVVMTGCFAVRVTTVSGVVLTSTGKPLADAVVTIDGKKVTTDKNGAFTVQDVREGKRSVRIDIDGQAITRQVEVKEGLAPLEIVLDPMNWARGKSYVYNIEPHENYPDRDGKMTDGVRASTSWSDTAWVGHNRENYREITVDLGSVRPIRELRTAFLQSAGVGVGFPSEVIWYVSADGENWEEVGTIQLKSADYPNPGIAPADVEELDVEARYVRLYFTVSVWVFLDEIEIWG